MTTNADPPNPPPPADAANRIGRLARECVRPVDAPRALHLAPHLSAARRSARLQRGAHHAHGSAPLHPAHPL